MSFLDGFIGGAAGAGAGLLANSIQNDQTLAMRQANDDLDVKKAAAIAQVQQEIANAPLKRFSALAQQLQNEDIPVAPKPVVPLAQSAAPDIPPDGFGPPSSLANAATSVPGGQNGYANEGQMRATAAGDMGADPQAIKREMATITNDLATKPLSDDDKQLLQGHLVDLQNQLSKVQPTGVADIRLVPKSQRTPDTSDAASAQPTTRKRTADEAFQAALDQMKLTDPQAYAAALPLMTPKTITVGQGSTILDAKDPTKVIYASTSPMDKQLEMERFKAGQQEKSENAKLRALWLNNDPMGINPQNPFTNTQTSNGGTTGSSGAIQQAIAANVTGDDFLKVLPTPQATQVKALAEGRMAFPGGMALKTPYWQSMLSLVSQYDPTFDATDYNKRSQTATAFAKGKQGDAVRAVNQTIYHMGSLSDAIDNLDNGSFKPWNYVANTAQEGLTDSTTQGVFRQKVQAVSSELRKVFSGSGGGNLTELKEWQESFPLNATKVQQKAYLNSAIDLLHGGIDALDQQYKAGMGNSANVTGLLSPKAQQTLDMLQGGGSTSQQSAQASPGNSQMRAPPPSAPANALDYSKLWNN